MQIVGAYVAAAAMALGVAPSLDAGVAPTAVQIRIDDEESLMDALLDFTQRRLRPVGLSVDRQHAQMTLSGANVPVGMYEISAKWRTDMQGPAEPLVFEMHRLIDSGERAGDTAREAFLAVPLMRDTAVAIRWLRKGSVFHCDDVRVEARTLKDVPKQPFPLPCRAETEVSTLRDIGPGDALRAEDVGAAFDVLVGAVVNVAVAAHGIHVGTTAVALSDARTGEQIDVRLDHPTRTLKARVTGPGSVQLVDRILQ